MAYEDIIGILLFALGGGLLLAALQVTLPYSGYSDMFASYRSFIAGFIAFLVIGAGLQMIVSSAVSPPTSEPKAK